MFDVGNSSLSWFSFTHPLSIPDCARIYLLNTLHVVQLMQLELLMCIFLEQLYTGSHESLDNLFHNTPLSILLFAVSYEVPPPRKKRQMLVVWIAGYNISSPEQWQHPVWLLGPQPGSTSFAGTFLIGLNKPTSQQIKLICECLLQNRKTRHQLEVGSDAFESTS